MLILMSSGGAPSEPVTVDEAKEHLRVFHDADDAMIARLIAAGREAAERYTGRALAIASWRVTLDCFPSVISLPLWAASGIDQITYLGADNARQTLSADSYTLDGDRNTVVAVEGWPSGSAVNVDFSTTPENVPEAIKDAIVLLVKASYEATTPAEIDGYTKAAEAKLHPYRLGLGV